MPHLVQILIQFTIKEKISLLALSALVTCGFFFLNELSTSCQKLIQIREGRQWRVGIKSWNQPCKWTLSHNSHTCDYLPQGMVPLQSPLSVLQVGPIPLIRISRDLAQYESKTTLFFSVAIFHVCNVFIFLYSYFYPEYLCFRYKRFGTMTWG